MDNEVFDNVKYEKAKAMARYNQFQNLKKMLQVFEVIVAVILISWSWTRVPSAFKFTGEVLVKVSAYLFKPHVVFLIGNGIIVAIVVLCRQSSDSVPDVGIHRDEVVQEPIVADLPVSSPPETAEPSVVTTEDKQIVPVERTVPEIQCNDVKTAIDTATKQIQKFKRTQSEKLKREITATPRKELRRSETDTGRKSAAARLENGVEKLSNEEFRLTIEAFIKKNQQFFEKQRLAETEPEKFERIGIKAY